MAEPELGDLIDKYTELQVQRRFHESQSETLTRQMAVVEEQIIHVMTEQHLERAAHGGTMVTPKQHTYAHVEDWPKLYDFIDQNKYWHLLERRVSVTGYRELLDLGRAVPGVVPFVKTKLSVTKSER